VVGQKEVLMFVTTMISLCTGFDGRPHPDNAEHDKYALCVDGITQLKANCASVLPFCYVWLDFGCINQNGNPAGELKQLDKIVQSSDCIFTPIGKDSLSIFLSSVIKLAMLYLVCTFIF
jgi:hypothetical protein